MSAGAWIGATLIAGVLYVVFCLGRWAERRAIERINHVYHPQIWGGSDDH